MAYMFLMMNDNAFKTFFFPLQDPEKNVCGVCVYVDVWYVTVATQRVIQKFSNSRFELASRLLAYYIILHSVHATCTFPRDS